MATWNSGFESEGSQNTVVGTYPNLLNATREEVRIRMENQHLTYDNGTTGGQSEDWVHTYGSCVPYVAASAPEDNLTNGVLWYQTTTGYVYKYDESGNVWDVISTGLLGSEIRLWYGSSGAIPSGWYVCNGQTVEGITLPDLINYYLKMGATSGSTGGNEDNVLNLTTAQLPSHTHGLDSTSKASLAVTIKTWALNIFAGLAGIAYYTTDKTIGVEFTNSDSTAIVTTLGGTTEETGSGNDINIEPMYYGIIPIAFIPAAVQVAGP